MVLDLALVGSVPCSRSALSGSADRRHYCNLMAYLAAGFMDAVGGQSGRKFCVVQRTMRKPGILVLLLGDLVQRSLSRHLVNGTKEAISTLKYRTPLCTTPLAVRSTSRKHAFDGGSWLARVYPWRGCMPHGVYYSTILIC